MPPAKSPKSRAKSSRAEPYPSRKPVEAAEAAESAPTHGEAKENDAPPEPNAENTPKKDDASSKSTEKSAPKKDDTTVTPKSKAAAKKDAGGEKANADLPDSYLDIVLEEKDGEVPCYENAAVIRRKLKALLDKKAKIPGSNKTFNKTSLSHELGEIAKRHHAIETTAGTRADGPSVKAITAFLNKTGIMGGGDSETYYYGNMLLEMMRIWSGEKKGKPREKAEEEFPKGRYRTDPAHFKILCRPGEQPSRSEVANMKR